MIVDIFDGDLYFHCLGMIKRSIKNSHECHFYLIKVTSEEYKKMYEELFAEFDYTNYKICTPEDKVASPPLVLCLLCKLKKQTAKEEISLLTEIYRHRKDILLLHGNLLTALCACFLLLNRWKNLNWICWGYFSAEFEVRSWKIAIGNWCTKVLYRKFKRIICLMQPDVEKAKEKYKCRRVFLCPYPRDFKNTGFGDTSISSDNKILIGNSSHAVNSYIALTEKLIPYKDFIDLTYMIPYGTEYFPQTVEGFKKQLQTEGFKYNFWDKVLPIEEYENEMKKYQIYVCPYDTQTGLGAIYTMLDNNVTLYLTGFNLAWLTFLGIKAYHVEDFIERVKNQEALNMDMDIREQNKTLLKELFDGKRRIEKLEQLLLNDENLHKLDSNWL